MSRTYHELLTDFNTAKRLSIESGEPFDAFVTAYIQKRWSPDEIRIYAADYLELTRRHEYNAVEECQRIYWQKWLDRLADENVRNAKIAAYSKAQSKNAKAKNREKTPSLPELNRFSGSKSAELY